MSLPSRPFKLGTGSQRFTVLVYKAVFVCSRPFSLLLTRPSATFEVSTTPVRKGYSLRWPVVTVHFSAALKALVLGNLFKVFRLNITFARDVCHLGIKMKKIWQSSHSFHYPQWQKARANVMANLSNLNELPKTRVSLQLKMDRLK